MERQHEILLKLGSRVRELRKAKGLSQEAFAGLCGLDRTYISGIERGVRNVSIINIEALAIGLGVPLSKLLEGL